MIASSSSLFDTSDSGVESKDLLVSPDDCQDTFVGYKTIHHLASFDTYFKPIADLVPLKAIVNAPTTAASHPAYCELNVSDLVPLSMKNLSFSRVSPYGTYSQICVPVTGLVTMPRSGNSHVLQSIIDADAANKNSDISFNNRPIQGIRAGLSGLYKYWNQDLTKRVLPLFQYANFVQACSAANINYPAPVTQEMGIINLDLFSRVTSAGYLQTTLPGMNTAQLTFVKTRIPILIDYQLFLNLRPNNDARHILMSVLLGNTQWQDVYILVDRFNTVLNGYESAALNIVAGPKAKPTYEVCLSYLYRTMNKEDFFLAMVFYPSSAFEGYSFANSGAPPNTSRILVPQYDFLDHLDSLPPANTIEDRLSNISWSMPPSSHTPIKYYNTIAYIINRLLTQMSAYQMGVPIPFPRLPSNNSNLTDGLGLSIYSVASPFQYGISQATTSATFNMIPWEMFSLFGGTMSNVLRYVYPPTVRHEGEFAITVEGDGNELFYMTKDESDTHSVPGWAIVDDNAFQYVNSLSQVVSYNNPDKLFPGGPLYVNSILPKTRGAGLFINGVHQGRFIQPHKPRFTLVTRNHLGLKAPGKL